MQFSTGYVNLRGTTHLSIAINIAILDDPLNAFIWNSFVHATAELLCCLRPDWPTWWVTKTDTSPER